MLVKALRVLKCVCVFQFPVFVCTGKCLEFVCAHHLWTQQQHVSQYVCMQECHFCVFVLIVTC